MVRIAPGLAPLVHGGGGPDGHQRGDFHAAADAGQSGRLRGDLRLGHLVPVMADSSVGRTSSCDFVADTMAAIFPLLDYFNISAGISGGRSVPVVYLAWRPSIASLCCVAMLVALLLFEDRDLA